MYKRQAYRRIAEGLDSLKRALRRESGEELRLRDAGAFENRRSRELIAADPHHARRIYHRDPLRLQHLGDALILIVRDATREHHVVSRAEGPAAEDGVADILQLAGNAEAFRRLFQQFLLGTEPCKENAQRCHCLLYTSRCV